MISSLDTINFDSGKSDTGTYSRFSDTAESKTYMIDLINCFWIDCSWIDCSWIDCSWIDWIGLRKFILMQTACHATAKQTVCKR
jgi:hypothetical protein